MKVCILEVKSLVGKGVIPIYQPFLVPLIFEE